MSLGSTPARSPEGTAPHRGGRRPPGPRRAPGGEARPSRRPPPATSSRTSDQEGSGLAAGRPPSLVVSASGWSSRDRGGEHVGTARGQCPARPAPTDDERRRREERGDVGGELAVVGVGSPQRKSSTATRPSRRRARGWRRAHGGRSADSAALATCRQRCLERSRRPRRRSGRRAGARPGDVRPAPRAPGRRWPRPRPPACGRRTPRRGRWRARPARRWSGRRAGGPCRRCPSPAGAATSAAGTRGRARRCRRP